MKMEKGLALQDILTEVHTYVHRRKLRLKFNKFKNECTVDK